MNGTAQAPVPGEPQGHARWGGVLALSLGAFALVASEFMPVSLLTPLAADFRITEGHAGLAISVSGAFALVTSLMIAAVVGRMDRKLVLLYLTLLMVISGTIAAFAPSFSIFLIGRALIGIAIGGFWSLSAATAIRLVPTSDVPKALALVNGGNALAVVVAAPLGSFLGSVIGWRGAFFCLVPVAALAFAWKAIFLPPMTGARPAHGMNSFRILKKPTVALGLVAVSMFFMGQFTLYTYLRPYLETVARMDATGISILLLLVGLAGLVGTAAMGAVLKKGLFGALIAIPGIMAGIALALASHGASVAITGALLVGWGLVATSAPVAWWTWLAKTLPDDTEAGGGLMVAIVQLAIAFGATGGGTVFDLFGDRATFAMSAVLLLIASALAALLARSARSLLLPAAL